MLKSSEKIVKKKIFFNFEKNNCKKVFGKFFFVGETFCVSGFFGTLSKGNSRCIC